MGIPAFGEELCVSVNIDRVGLLTSQGGDIPYYETWLADD